MAAQNPLLEWFPSTKAPVVISAPMFGLSNGTLAAEVTKAGGLGMVPGGFDFTPGGAPLAHVDKELSKARAVLSAAGRGGEGAVLEVGVGFIFTHESVAPHFEAAIRSVVAKHRPAAVWLFAPPQPQPGAEAEAPSQAAYVRAVREAAAAASYEIRIFVQVGTVAAARRAAAEGADVVVAQGIDAGGHQFAGGSGVVGLVPEVRDMLDAEFASQQQQHRVALVAAGGIADGRGVAAALALGADGAVLGTRFLVSNEASTPEWQRKVYLETRDGGLSTNKSKLHDKVRGTSFLWPPIYDGRAIITESYRDLVAGVSVEDVMTRYTEAHAAGDKSREVTWAGAAVGLVNEALPAGEIVTTTREQAKARLRALQSWD